MSNLETSVQALLQPSEALIKDMADLDGDIMLLGAGGKIGPSLGLLAKKAVSQSGKSKKIICVSRFSDREAKETLESNGIQTISADLLKEEELRSLPDTKNIIYLAGTKFGTIGKEPFTWAMNTYLPGRVAEKFKSSRIIVYSTGNVYPFSSVYSGGADESVPPKPIGEYAQSCLGRERIFEYFSQKYKTPILIFRLNYSNDLKYGVLLEIGKAVKEGRAIDLRMGFVNVIWQGDVNEFTLRAFHHCSHNPAKLLNVTGPETASVRWIATEFGRKFNREPVFEGAEQEKSLLNNAAESFKLFGYPNVSLSQMIDLTSGWIIEEKETIDKPTHFQEREGNF